MEAMAKEARNKGIVQACCRIEYKNINLMIKTIDRTVDRFIRVVRVIDRYALASAKQTQRQEHGESFIGHKRTKIPYPKEGRGLFYHR